jgi:FMN phosphatase YigB (HAD superfamily)
VKIELKHPVKHLLVDLDGTLLGNRNLPLSVDFMAQALSAMKRQVGSWRKAANTLLAIRKEFERPHNEITNDNRIVQIFSNSVGVSLDEGRKLLRESVFLIFPKLERYFFPIPGAKDFLNWASEHYTMTLATNPVWPVEIIELRLQWGGIDPKMFKRITDIRSMRACKPAPEYYRQILDLEQLKPEECLLIGNEMKMDLPAVRTGIPVFIVGAFKQVSLLQYPGGEAPAWRGSYSHLRAALERQLETQAKRDAKQRS